MKPYQGGFNYTKEKNGYLASSLPIYRSFVKPEAIFKVEDILDVVPRNFAFIPWPKAQIIPIPHVAVPTTAGTGAEVSPICVIFSKKARVKANLLHPFVNADIAVLDAAFCGHTGGFRGCLKKERFVPLKYINLPTWHYMHAAIAVTKKAFDSLTEENKLSVLRIGRRYEPMFIKEAREAERK